MHARQTVHFIHQFLSSINKFSMLRQESYAASLDLLLWSSLDCAGEEGSRPNTLSSLKGGKKRHTSRLLYLVVGEVQLLLPYKTKDPSRLCWRGKVKVASVGLEGNTEGQGESQLSRGMLREAALSSQRPGISPRNRVRGTCVWSTLQMRLMRPHTAEILTEDEPQAGWGNVIGIASGRLWEITYTLSRMALKSTLQWKGSKYPFLGWRPFTSSSRPKCFTPQPCPGHQPPSFSAWGPLNPATTLSSGQGVLPGVPHAVSQAQALPSAHTHSLTSTFCFWWPSMHLQDLAQCHLSPTAIPEQDDGLPWAPLGSHRTDSTPVVIL